MPETGTSLASSPHPYCPGIPSARLPWRGRHSPACYVRFASSVCSGSRHHVLCGDCASSDVQCPWILSPALSTGSFISADTKAQVALIWRWINDTLLSPFQSRPVLLHLDIFPCTPCVPFLNSPSHVSWREFGFHSPQHLLLLPQKS